MRMSFAVLTARLLGIGWLALSACTVRATEAAPDGGPPASYGHDAATGGSGGDTTPDAGPGDDAPLVREDAATPPKDVIDTDLTPGQMVTANPCGKVPVAGQCTSASEVTRCVVPTDNAPPYVETATCSAVEECKVVDGKASCALKDGKCAPGASRCGSVS